MVTSETIISVFAKHEDLFLLYRTLLKRQSTLCLKRSECDSNIPPESFWKLSQENRKSEFAENDRYDYKNELLKLTKECF